MVPLQADGPRGGESTGCIASSTAEWAPLLGC
jgi:hypothetical protein